MELKLPISQSGDYFAVSFYSCVVDVQKMAHSLTWHSSVLKLVVAAQHFNNGAMHANLGFT
jgi:hypothetical protein